MSDTTAIFIRNGRISGTRVRSQISGTPPDGEYVLVSEAREIIASEIEAEVERIIPAERNALSYAHASALMKAVQFLRSRSTEASPTKEET